MLKMLKRFLTFVLLSLALFQTLHAYMIDHHESVYEYVMEFEQPSVDEECAHFLLHLPALLQKNVVVLITIPKTKLSFSYASFVAQFHPPSLLEPPKTPYSFKY